MKSSSQFVFGRELETLGSVRALIVATIETSLRSEFIRASWPYPLSNIFGILKTKWWTSRPPFFSFYCN